MLIMIIMIVMIMLMVMVSDDDDDDAIIQELENESKMLSCICGCLQLFALP